MKKIRGNTPIKRKRPLCQDDLNRIVSALPNPSYNDRLFIAMTFTAFFGLLRLGELTLPDCLNKRSAKKIARRYTLTLADTHFSFHLPYHKGDRFFEGNTVMIQALSNPVLNPVDHVRRYLASRDQQHPFLYHLWLTENGNVPTYSWFVSRLKRILGTDVGGHSLRSGGATHLALTGASDSTI